MKYDDLTKEEIKIIEGFIKKNENEFREFVTLHLAKVPESYTIDAEELAYEFTKSLIRDDKISKILNYDK